MSEFRQKVEKVTDLLTNRKQRVVLNGEWSSVTNGIPQASIISDVETIEKANFSRIISLVINVGTDVLRKIFLEQIRPLTVVGESCALARAAIYPVDLVWLIEQQHVQYLPVRRLNIVSDMGKRFEIDALKKKCVLTDHMYALVTDVSPNETKFDISLLVCLLRSLCAIALPAQGWKKIPPDETDVSLAADLLRFKEVRNGITAHTPVARMEPGTFKTIWIDIKTILKRLSAQAGIPDEEIWKRIDHEKKCQLDPSTERQNMELFTKWHKEEVTMYSVKLRLLRLHIEEAVRHVGNNTQTGLSSLQDELASLTVEMRGVLTNTAALQGQSNHSVATVAEILSVLQSMQDQLDTVDGRLKELTQGHNTQQTGSDNVICFQQNIQSAVFTHVVNNLHTDEAGTCEVNTDVRKETHSNTGIQKSYAQTAQMTKAPMNVDETGACGVDKDFRKGTTSTTGIRKSYTQAAQMSKTTTDAHMTANLIQNFDSANIINIFPPTTDTACSELASPNKTMVSDILSAVDYFNGSTSQYLLIIGPIQNNHGIEALSLVPWAAVFDFDQNSRQSGILSVVENSIRIRRSLHIDSWQDKISINSNSTRWIFMRGSRENPESIIDVDFSKWSKKTKKNMDNTIIPQLSEYGDNYTAVVIWPSGNTNKADYRCFHRLLTDLESGISSTISIVIIEDPESNTAIGDGYIQIIMDDQEDKCKHFQIPIAQVCSAIEQCLSGQYRTVSKCLQLPTSNKDSKVTMSHDEAAYLKEELEVLYCNDTQYEDEAPKMNLSQLEVECDNFLRGGTLPWDILDLRGAGYLDVERDEMAEMIRHMRRDHINCFKSGRITLYHWPGSGGTTMSHRILWELRQVTPCAEVKLRTGSTIQELADKVEKLYDKTQLPILLLMDGEEEPKVAQLERALRDICVIILHVMRRPYTELKAGKHMYCLRKHVSKKEATCLALTFTSQSIDDKAKDAIRQLEKDVHNGEERSIFDFGITAYNYKYKGISSYVNGFLDLANNKNHTITPSQEALGILSLVHYYGQSGLPCQFFANMFKCQKQGMSIDDFPENMKGLIVPDRSEEKRNIVRISHYLVAKEILDQVIPFPSKREGQPEEFLSKEAKNKLAEFAILFLKQAGDDSHRSTNMIKIMTKTFISRDNKPAGENETVPRKANLAPILEDASQQSPYTARFRILEQLTTSFPMEPQFCAHLGRLYTICREEDDVNALKWFSKAEALCDSLMNGQCIDGISHNMKLTLMHVYHMYGIMCSRMVAKYTGKMFGDRPTLPTECEELKPTTERLLKLVSRACSYFTKSRQVTPRGYEKSFYFIGEIQVRLMFCDFIHSHRKSGTVDLYDFMNDVDNSDSQIVDFLEDSLIQIDDLFLDCFSVVDQNTMDHTIKHFQIWFMALFKRNPRHVQFRVDEDSIHSRRLAIIQTKLQYGTETKIPFLEYIDSAEDITYIVKQHEAIFEKVAGGGLAGSSKRQLDIGYREWVYAIRHECYEQTYSIETVLEIVRQWFEMIQTPQSRFYLFILESLLGFGTTSMHENTELLIKAQQSKEDLLNQSKFLIRPKYPQEWLGIGEGIKRLQPGQRFFGQIDRRQIPAEFLDNLQIMKGTICKPNMKPAWGFINLDYGVKKLVSVRVFFVPAISNTKGPSFAGRRVEFVLAFSIGHGYEAFNVRLLTKLKCPECLLTVEVHTGDRTIFCPRCKMENKRSVLQE